MNKLFFFFLALFFCIACENEKSKPSPSTDSEKEHISFKNLPDQLLFSIGVESNEDSVKSILTNKGFVFNSSLNAYIHTSPESKVHVYPFFNNNEIYQLVIALHFENKEEKVKKLNRLLTEISENASKSSQNKHIHEYIFMNDQAPRLRVLIKEKSTTINVRMKLIQRI